MVFEESYTTELKEIVTSDLKKEVVAFSNSDGGIIYVGVKNDGSIKGIKNTDEEMQKIGNMIRDGIHPDLTQHTKIETISIDHHDIIRIEVQSGIKKPYHLRDKGLKPSGVYIRHGVSSVNASEETIRNMIRITDGDIYDQSRCLNQELTFTYADYIFKLKEIPFDDAHKRTLGLLDKDGFYTNTALLLSDQCEHNIKCAVFQGDNRLVFKARKEFNGSILKQMDDVLTYLDMYSNDNTEIQGISRKDYPDYPKAALREVIINALVHRDYTYTGSILANVFDTRIEIISLGSLVKGLKYEDIISGVSQTRNMSIAQIFYRLAYIESYGTGIQRILELYQNAEQKPELIVNPASFLVKIPKFKRASLSANKRSSREDIVFRRIKEEGRITRKEVEELLACSSFTANRVLNHLLDEHRIKSMGSARATFYIPIL